MHSTVFRTALMLFPCALNVSFFAIITDYYSSNAGHLSPCQFALPVECKQLHANMCALRGRNECDKIIKPFNVTTIRFHAIVKVCCHLPALVSPGQQADPPAGANSHQQILFVYLTVENESISFIYDIDGTMRWPKRVAWDGQRQQIYVPTNLWNAGSNTGGVESTGVQWDEHRSLIPLFSPLVSYGYPTH